ncbi:MAG TPA: N(4)-(beta-N-acetylglucosaminyl)-L-asparaginase [Gemmatimonadaceae bacterium]|jgi:N4-(beta-N-acetylglucosaminyl)-L-asparaginase|nr:N(4)-(beta-N-acetylglucosaminyl)-L-asparaginase [Gemmatimonadaceae bacterium]
MSVSRRDFLAAGATAAAGVALGNPLLGESPGVTHRVSGTASSAGVAARPVVIASDNGIRGVKKAYDMIVAGADTLDAIIAGVNIQELDPDDMSVGLGGLPNEDGVVQLDASCMHGPTKRAGAVGCLEDIATPSLVAKAVMDYTDHIMLVGHDAKRFALKMGFKEQNLLTEKSRLEWIKWKSRLNANDMWLEPADTTALPSQPSTRPNSAPRRTPPSGGGGGGEKITYDEYGVAHTWGTINMNAVDANGDMSSVTTTSGIAWKIAGRVGDSPIIGAGQYCDNTVGAAGSTGRGESNIKVCGAFLAVELMRQGLTPEQSIMKVMERVLAMTEKRLLNDRGRPYFDLQFYALAKDGRFAAATAYEGSQFAVCDAQGPRHVDCAYLFKESERPKKR